MRRPINTVATMNSRNMAFILIVLQTFLIAESMRGVLVHDYRTKHKIKHE